MVPVKCDGMAISAGVDVDVIWLFWKNLPERGFRACDPSWFSGEVVLLAAQNVACIGGTFLRWKRERQQIDNFLNEHVFGICFIPGRERYIPVSNVLLGIVVLFLNGLPDTNASKQERDLELTAIFRDDGPAVAQPLLQPRWLKDSSKNQQINQGPVFRGQGPGGTSNGSKFASPTFTAQAGTPYQPQDPFQIQSGPDPVLPYLNEPGPSVLSGINGPQPHRFGFTPIVDAAFIIPSRAKGPGGGQFGVQEYDLALKHVSLLGPDWVFTNTLQAGTRVWTGPATPNLPPEVYRFGWDFLLNSPQYAGWSAQASFNPSLNTDFGGSFGREALNLDANATLLYRVSPEFLLVMGVQYWDRVDNIIIPNAGVVWNPNELLEMRLLFPKSRISYFLGNFGNAAHWLYASGEYHVESYQIHAPGASREQIQLSDYRAAIGLRSDHTWYDKFIEVGYVFNRKADFLRSTPGFNINDGVMARIGFRF